MNNYYHYLAAVEKDKHAKLYPDYELRPRKPYEIKRRAVRATMLGQFSAADVFETAHNLNLHQAEECGDSSAIARTLYVVPRSESTYGSTIEFTPNAFEGEVSVADEVLRDFEFNFDVAGAAADQAVDNGVAGFAQDYTSGMFINTDDLFSA